MELCIAVLGNYLILPQSPPHLMQYQVIKLAFLAPPTKNTFRAFSFNPYSKYINHSPKKKKVDTWGREVVVVFPPGTGFLPPLHASSGQTTRMLLGFYTYDRSPVPAQQSSAKPCGARLSTWSNLFSCGRADGHSVPSVPVASRGGAERWIVQSNCSHLAFSWALYARVVRRRFLACSQASYQLSRQFSVHPPKLS